MQSADQQSSATSALENNPLIQQQQYVLFPHDFTKINRLSLRLSPLNYNCYRVCMLMIITALFTLLLLYGPQLRNFAYLTYWGFTTALIYFLVGVIENMLLRVIDPQFKLPVWKFLHFIFMNLLGVEIMINCVFWFVFFPFILHYHHQSGTPFNWIDTIQAIGAHLVPLCMLIIDMNFNLVCFWNRHPRRYLITTMLIYLGFNMIYTLEMGPIYPVLTYTDVLTFIFVGGNVIGAFICYEVMFYISKRLKNKRVLEMLRKANPALTIQINNENYQSDQSPNTAGMMHHPFTDEKEQKDHKYSGVTMTGLPAGNGGVFTLE